MRQPEIFLIFPNFLGSRVLSLLATGEATRIYHVCDQKSRFAYGEKKIW